VKIKLGIETMLRPHLPIKTNEEAGSISSRLVRWYIERGHIKGIHQLGMLPFGNLETARAVLLPRAKCWREVQDVERLSQPLRFARHGAGAGPRWRSS